jgi:hypothetical protein
MLGALLAQLANENALPANSGLKAAAWAVATVLSTAIEVLQYFASIAFALGIFYLISWLMKRQASVVNAPTAPIWRAKPMEFISMIGRISLWAYLLNQPILNYVEVLVRPHVYDPLRRILVTAFLGALVVLPLAWALQRYVEPHLVRFADAVMSALGSFGARARRGGLQISSRRPE